MLTKSIIKHQPKVHQYQGGVGWKYKNKSEIVNQQALDDFLDKSYKVGDIVRMRSNTNVCTSYALHLVLSVEKDFNKLEFNYEGTPKTHEICAVGCFERDPTNAYPRWEEMKSYVLAEGTLIEKLVDDKLQNNLKTFIEKRQG